MSSQNCNHHILLNPIFMLVPCYAREFFDLKPEPNDILLIHAFLCFNVGYTLIFS